MLSIQKKDLIPHLTALVVFLGITFLFFAPSLFGDKELYQHDILQAKGSNQQLAEYEQETGEEPLWLNAIFSGMPAYLNGVDFSTPVIKTFHFIIRGGIDGAASTLFISCISFYVLLLAFGVNPWLSILGGLVFGLNGFSIISLSAGHNSKVLAVAVMPLVLAGIHLTFTGRRLAGFALTTLALGLELYANHLQITYYLLLMVVGYGFYQLYLAYQGKELKPFFTTIGVLIVAALLAVGMNTGKIWTVYEYSAYSIRGQAELTRSDEPSTGLEKDYAFEFSNGIFEPLVMFIPGILGGSSTEELSKTSEVAKTLRQAGYQGSQLDTQLKNIPTYWGQQRLTAPYYAGIIPVFLFVLGLIVLPRRQKVWLVVLLCLGIVLSWGKNFESFNYFIFDYLPFYNKFRSVTFTIIISIIALYLLGFYGLDQWLKQEDKKKPLLLAVAISGGFALLLIVISGFLSYRGAVDANLPEWFVEALREDRKSMLRTDAFKALVFILIAGGLLWFYSRQKLKKLTMLAGLGLLIAFDMIAEAKDYISYDSFQKSTTRNYFAPTEADRFIEQNTASGERVLNLQNPFNEARTSYFHESIGGYHGAKMRRYQDLIEHCIHRELNNIITTLQAGERNYGPTPVLNMLNTKYFVAGNTQNAVLRNANALGSAWLATSIEYVTSPDEEIAQTCSLDPGAAVIDRSRFDLTLSNPATGQITLDERTPNRLSYTVTTAGEALAVFSEVYYPKGWKATIDGEDAEILRANYVLRALQVPPGEHRIEFRFEPSSYYTGQAIITGSSVVFVLIFFGFLAADVYRKRQKA